MGTAQRVSADSVDELVEDLRRGLSAEMSHAYRYLLLARVAGQAGLSEAVEIVARTAEEEWQHVSGLMRRVTDLGGGLGSRPVTATDSETLARILHPSGRSSAGGHFRVLLAASIEEDRSTIRYYADLCDKTWDADPVTAQLALRFLIEETESEDRLERLLTP